MNRKNLIYYAIKYNGDYNQITEAVKQVEELVEKADSTINELEKRCSICTILDDNYPKRFLDLEKPPYVLFYRGNLNLIKENKNIGFCGNPNPSEYAKMATIDLLYKNTDKNAIVKAEEGLGEIVINHSNKCVVISDSVDSFEKNIKKFCSSGINDNFLFITEYINNPENKFKTIERTASLIANSSWTLYVMESNGTTDVIETANKAIESGKEIKVLPFDVYTKTGKYNLKLIHSGTDIITVEDLH